MNKYFVALLCVSSCSYAAEQSYVTQLRTFLKTYHVAGTTRLNSEHEKKIKFYFKQVKKTGEDVNQKDAQGRTIAHDFASTVPSIYWLDATKVFNHLSMAGVNFVAKDCEGKTPCDVASERLALLIDLKERFAQKTKTNKNRTNSFCHFENCCKIWAQAHKARLAREAQGKVSSSSNYDGDEEGVGDE